MIRSMTAFARQSLRGEWGTVTWELRSVNHRYLEPFLRLPDALRPLEGAVRERLNERLKRGKVECSLRFEAGPRTFTGLALNRPLAERLVALGRELEGLTGHPHGLQPGDLLRWPGIVDEPDLDTQALIPDVMVCLDQALDDLIATREREGDRLKALLLSRCRAVADLVSAVRQRRPQVLAAIRDRLTARLAELPANPDPYRLEQELVLVAQRLDVDEELDRLDALLVEFRTALGRDEPVGRRLDFLLQEFNREANTLSSKSHDTETTRAGVEIKVLIEQLREQVQNLE
ncbi:MAG: YicC/YloC family endoribonuclease [Candidatus Competibacterales bacterium]